jgi:hypothetical protein
LQPETNKVLLKAEVAHLVEHDLAKVGVAGSSPVFRSFYLSYPCPESLAGQSFTTVASDALHLLPYPTSVHYIITYSGAAYPLIVFSTHLRQLQPPLNLHFIRAHRRYLRDTTLSTLRRRSAGLPPTDALAKKSYYCAFSL